MAKISNNETAKDSVRTVFVMQMGQFIDHDFAHSPNFQEPANCCNEKKEIDIELEEHKKNALTKHILIIWFKKKIVKKCGRM